MNTIEMLLRDKVLVLDGAMGTMIQQFKLEEGDYRGERFKNWHKDLKGHNDLLSITKPSVIEDIHLQYLEAGADIIETNTFNSQKISLEDFDMQDLAYELNVASAKVAKQASLLYEAKCKKKTYVAGAIGPTNKTLSMSPNVNDPSFRSVSFDDVAGAYYEQVKGLVDGGVDILLIETIFDTLNAKAAIYAIERFFKDTGKEKLPIMLSVTISDNSGRTLSGQTLEAFYISIAHAKPLSVGLNCALGGKQMKPYLQLLKKISGGWYTSCYPNAGLPNALGEYDELPEMTAKYLNEMLEEGVVNIIGGCCGTTPKHIKAIAELAKKYSKN